jgi:hypothetical protein
MFDTGHLLALLAQYYWYTGDATLIIENEETIGRVLNLIRQARRESLEKYGADDPRHGLIAGIMNNDVRDVGFYYTTDGPIWAGLRDYAEALKAIGTAMGKQAYRKRGESLAAYARAYYADLRASIDRAIEWEGGRITYIHIHPVLEPGSPPVACPYRERSAELHAQMRFHEWPRFIGSGVLSDQEIQFLFDYEYAYMHYMLSPGLWSGFEQVQVVPRSGDPGRLTGAGTYLPSPRLYGFEGAHATWPVLRLTKQIFVFDEPGGEAVWVGRGIPRHWLSAGRPVEAKRVPTRYGEIDLRYQYDADAGTLRVRLNPRRRRPIPQLHVGVRDPFGGQPVSVEALPSPGREAILDRDRALLTLRGVDQPITLTVHFRRPEKR